MNQYNNPETMGSGNAQIGFAELLKASFKSEDTEEWLDVHFTRPIGLMFALIWRRLGVHPNAITILSIFLGVAAAVMFYQTDLGHNLLGILLLMLANFCDSTDGQLARLTNQKTLIGRILDGFAGDIWFFAIYVAICLRLMTQHIPLTNTQWGITIWILGFVAGVICHSPQSSLADYYRQIHLYFLKGKQGSELDNSEQQRINYQTAAEEGNRVKRMISRAFYYNYANYCHSQEKRTPKFQTMYSSMRRIFQDIASAPRQMREEFLDGSRPLMKYTNILTFNVRAICIYITCLLNCPWVYLLIEIIPMSIMYMYMHHRHEQLCGIIQKRYLSQN